MNRQPPRPAGEIPDPVLTARANARTLRPATSPAPPPPPNPLSSILTVVHGDDAATTPTHTGQTTLMCSVWNSGQAERTAFLIAARDLFALRLRERRRESWPVRVWLENTSPDDNPTGTLLYTAGDLSSWSTSAVGPSRGLMTFADGSSISDAALVRVTF